MIRKILKILESNKIGLSFIEVKVGLKKLKINVTDRTIRRDLDDLCKINLADKRGHNKNTFYKAIN